MRVVTGVLALLLLVSTRASAQQGVIAQASGAAVTVNGGTGVAFGGGAGYRFNRAFGLGVEISRLEELTVDPFYRVARNFGRREGSATVFTTNVRLEMPTTSGRVIPFAVAGAGVASLTDSRDVVYYATTNAGSGSQLDPTLPGLALLPGSISLRTTTLNMALTLGGGASFLILDHVSVDADLRVLRVVGDTTRNMGRFGGGVSYRF